MRAMPVTMDGREYRVLVVYNSLVRAFELLEGENAGEMLSGRYERDLIGSQYAYEMQIEPDPEHVGDYDDFYEAITAPQSTHSVTMPYGQSTITFAARIISGTDQFVGTVGGVKHWKALTVQFVPIQPQRSAT